MTALVRLYPRAWRDRYESEFLAVLADRPPRLGDRLDILLGALDAHLDPEVAEGAPDPAIAETRGRRTRGAAWLAAIGGGLWLVAVVALLTAPIDEYGSHDSNIALVCVLIANLALGGASLLLASRRPDTARAAALAGVMLIVGAGLMLLGWPLLPLGVYGGFVASMLIGEVIVRAGTPVVGVALVLAALVAFAFSTVGQMALLAVPFGLAWVAVGAWAIVSPVRRPLDEPRGG